ncbi:hypothetical protein GOODEAATRI_013045 [Goodea atripinnis]|uniref:Uncharacterized protein n=1 Tax=Goodea atripinnis TaxID=208336 RepID=A0ABV0P3Q2_9TELE
MDVWLPGLNESFLQECASLEPAIPASLGQQGPINQSTSYDMFVLRCAQKTWSPDRIVSLICAVPKYEMLRSQAEHHAWNPLLPLLADTCGEKDPARKKLTEPHCYLPSTRHSSAALPQYSPSSSLHHSARGRSASVSEWAKGKGSIGPAHRRRRWPIRISSV